MGSELAGARGGEREFVCSAVRCVLLVYTFEFETLVESPCASSPPPTANSTGPSPRARPGDVAARPWDVHRPRWLFVHHGKDDINTVSVCGLRAVREENQFLILLKCLQCA